MKWVTVAIGVTLLLAAAAAPADEPAACAVGSTNILGGQDKDAKGDVTINCAGMTEAFGNRLTDILNFIVQNRLDPRMVLAKLGEVDAVPEAGVARALTEDQRH